MSEQGEKLDKASNKTKTELCPLKTSGLRPTKSQSSVNSLAPLPIQYFKVH